jgi:hypothetical protein
MPSPATGSTVYALNLDIDVIEPTSLTDQLRALGRWLLDQYRGRVATGA